VPLLIALLLLAPGEWFGRSVLCEQFVLHTTLAYSLGLVLVITGAALAIVSRAMLGWNWSAVVQLKQDHELITSGLYRSASFGA
jgi:protein-S-isoprenylcysteine O-methyltransferase Ste14